MRPLNTATLTGAANHYMEEFEKPSVRGPSGQWIGGRSYVRDCLYNATFMDEHEWLVKYMKEKFDGDGQREFHNMCLSEFTPRNANTFEELLAEKLAINPEGEHIPGMVGTVIIGERIVGTRVVERPHYRVLPRTMKQRFLFMNGKLMEKAFFSPVTTELVGIDYKTKAATWPVYAGEPQERSMDSIVVDKLPEGAQGFSELAGDLMATNPKMSNAGAVTACNSLVDQFETLGTTAGTIKGYTTAQATDVDTAIGGQTLLFTLTLNLNDAFGTAVDDTGKATATANTITDDSSADATDTLAWCRCSSTGTGADDLFDGEAGTSASDFNFNTLSIVSGSTVSMSSFTISVSE